MLVGNIKKEMFTMYYKKMIGKRIYLSPIDPEDYKLYTEWINDMEVGLGITFSRMLMSEATEKEALERISKNGYNFAVIDNETNLTIGNVGFPAIDQVNRKGTVGIFIGDKKYWNNGYGGEALSLLMDFGFNILNLHSINLVVFGFNKPAIRCYEKIGFKEAGRLREAKIMAGEKYDEIYMDILASEFESPYIKELMDERIGK
jgi:RimJ/RimL family protein N-acetyltransferase